jgi:hypothetical protein
MAGRTRRGGIGGRSSRAQWIAVIGSPSVSIPAPTVRRQVEGVPSAPCRQPPVRKILVTEAGTRSQAGRLPSTRLIEEMGHGSSARARACVPLSGGGLQSTRRAMHGRLCDPEDTVRDVPFAGTSELLDGAGSGRAETPSGRPTTRLRSAGRSAVLSGERLRRPDIYIATPGRRVAHEARSRRWRPVISTIASRSLFTLARPTAAPHRAGDSTPPSPPTE